MPHTFSHTSFLRHKVLSKFPTRNMNDFAVEASRIGTRDWLDLQVSYISHPSIQAFPALFFLTRSKLRTERMHSPPSRPPWVLLRKRSPSSRQNTSRSFASRDVLITPGSRSPLRSIRENVVVNKSGKSLLISGPYRLYRFLCPPYINVPIS